MRTFPKSLKNRWLDPKGLIQILSGPRQVGKTTVALSLMEETHTVYASADLPTPPTVEFITSHWERARKIDHRHRTLILDEIQKIPRWSEVVKKLWDEDKKNKLQLRVCLLGSSAILIEKGLSESLTGRFEINYFPHWTFVECQKNLAASLQDYTLMGGYPKAYDFRDDPERLEDYLQNSILEPTLGRDILSLHSVDKPALLRQLFWYVSRLPSQPVSYEKILGHLQGRGNSATLVHYADLLAQAFLLCPIGKFSAKPHRTKRSIPKWIIPNPALVERSIRQAGPTGFVFENLVGSHLLNITFGRREYELHYWREEPWEVDFILTRHHEPLIALEVKSGQQKKSPFVDLLVHKGIRCSMQMVTQENILSFLKITEIEELVAWNS